MKPPSVADISYFARFGLVRLKQAAGITRTGDKTFFIERLSRLLKAGKGRSIKVLALGKNDGAGSQAFTSMSALAFAKAHGVTYVHRPFEMLEHEPTPAAVAAWENYFNLGEGELSLTSCPSPIVPIEEFLAAPALWGGDIIVAAEHFLHYCNEDPGAWPGVLPNLRAKYKHYASQSASSPALVCVHMRRGDVSAAAKLTSKNFTPNAAFAETVAGIQRALEKAGREAIVEIHSQGDAAAFAEFERLGCRLRLDEPAMQSHQRLVNADVLVMSRSSFSYTAALLCRGSVLYDREKYKPLPQWIVRAQDGTFDSEALGRQLAVDKMAGG